MIIIKILYLTISYEKEEHSLYNDLVDELLYKGHDVTIVRLDNDCNHSYYEPGKPSFLNVSKLNILPNNFVGKGISTLMMGYLFKNAIRNYLKNEKFDLIIYATPPITFNSAVYYCKKIFNCSSFLMLKDIFPQNAVDLQMFDKNSILYKYFRKKEVDLYNVSDYIGCMSQGNIDYLLKNNSFIQKSKIILFPNSIKITIDQKQPENNNEYTTFIFGGNLGKPQYIEGLLKLIDSLKSYDKAKFIICGKGTELRIIKSYLKEENRNKNLAFYEFLPSDEYKKILKNADVGILSLDPRFTIPNIPSRLQGYMLLKKPIFAFVDAHTDIGDIIEESNCGWYCCSDDIVHAKEVIIDICENKSLLLHKGLNGYDYLVHNFNIKHNVEVLEKLFEQGE